MTSVAHETFDVVAQLLVADHRVQNWLVAPFACHSLGNQLILEWNILEVNYFA